MYGRLGSRKDVAGLSKSLLSESTRDRLELSADRI